MCLEWRLFACVLDLKIYPALWNLLWWNICSELISSHYQIAVIFFMIWLLPWCVNEARCLCMGMVMKTMAVLRAYHITTKVLRIEWILTHWYSYQVSLKHKNSVEQGCQTQPAGQSSPANGSNQNCRELIIFLYFSTIPDLSTSQRNTLFKTILQHFIDPLIFELHRLKCMLFFLRHLRLSIICFVNMVHSLWLLSECTCTSLHEEKDNRVLLFIGYCAMVFLILPI